MIISISTYFIPLSSRIFFMVSRPSCCSAATMSAWTNPMPR